MPLALSDRPVRYRQVGLRLTGRISLNTIKSVGEIHSGHGAGPSQCARLKGRASKVQIINSASREAIMDSNQSGRRRFLKQAAALAGVAAGAGAGTEWAARGQSAK